MESPTSRAAADSAPREADTGARLGAALLVYMLGVILIATLLPFHFTWPDEWQISFDLDPYDAVRNVVLFAPLGFLYRMVTRPGWGALLLIVLNAALISVAIEGAQLFDATRDAAVFDVVSNTVGALVGVIAFDGIARSAPIDGRVIGWLSLELPLMGLVYLLLPLLWVSAMGGHGQLAPLAATFLAGVFGAILLGGLQRQYFGPKGTAQPPRTALFAAVWFIAGAFALAPWWPQEFVISTAVVAFITWFEGRRELKGSGSNRRFEGALLRRALPVYAAYLFVVIAAPVLEEARAWHGHFGFPDTAGAQVEIARLLALCAAFTLVGYMATESRGRELAGFRQALPRLIAWGVGLALAAEAVRGFSFHGASLVRGVLLAAACTYGGWLYLLQRAHVMWVVSRNRETPNVRIETT